MGEIWLLVLFSVSILTGVLWIDKIFLNNFYNLMIMKSSRLGVKNAVVLVFQCNSENIFSNFRDIAQYHIRIYFGQE